MGARTIWTAGLILCLLSLAPRSAVAQESHQDVVARVKKQLVEHGADLSSPNNATPCKPFAITRRVAWELRGEGIGLLSKPGGNQCEGYAVDALVTHEGLIFDILGDGGGANKAQWLGVGTADGSRWRAPIDPGQLDAPTPTSGDASSVQALLEQGLAQHVTLAMKLDDVLVLLSTVHAQLDIVEGTTDATRAEVSSMHNEGKLLARQLGTWVPLILGGRGVPK